MQKWASIPALAEYVGVSDNRARQYIKRFPDFFLSTTIDGIKKFPVESVEILKRI